MLYHHREIVDQEVRGMEDNQLISPTGTLHNDGQRVLRMTAKPDPHLEPVGGVVSSRIFATIADDIPTPVVVSFKFITNAHTVFCVRGDQKGCIVVVVPVERGGYYA
jgi:hypothetical protein